MLLQLLILQLATTSPQLHAWLHSGYEVGAETCSTGCSHSEESEDQNAKGEHRCAITLLAAGVVLFDTTVVIDAMSCGDVEFKTILVNWIGAPSFNLRLIRGPPALS